MKPIKLSLLALAAGIFATSCGNNNHNDETAVADTATLSADPGITTTDPMMGTAATTATDTATILDANGTGTADMSSGTANGNSGAAASTGASRGSGASSTGTGRVSTAPSTGTRTVSSSNTPIDVPSVGTSTGNQSNANTKVRRYDPTDKANSSEVNIRESTRSSQSAVGGATHPTNIPDRGLNSPR